MAFADRLVAFVEQADHGLRRRQIAGRHQHDDALARLLPDMHLLEGRDRIHAGIGARVRHEHEPSIDLEADAISHGISSSSKSWRDYCSTVTVTASCSSACPSRIP